MMVNISSVNTTAGYSTDKNLSSGPVKEQTRIKIDSVQKPDIVNETQNDKNVERIIKELKGPDMFVERSVHEGTHNIVYKLKDKVSGEIIREIPEERILDIAAKYIEINGLVIDEKV